MKKTIKKTMSMAVAMMMVVGVFVSTTFAFAANENVSSRYDKVNGKIRGTVNLSKVVKSDGREVVKKGNYTMKGLLKVEWKSDICLREHTISISQALKERKLY